MPPSIWWRMLLCVCRVHVEACSTAKYVLLGLVSRLARTCVSLLFFSHRSSGALSRDARGRRTQKLLYQAVDTIYIIWWISRSASNTALDGIGGRGLVFLRIISRHVVRRFSGVSIASAFEFVKKIVKRKTKKLIQAHR